MGEYTVADIEQMVDDIREGRGDWLEVVDYLATFAIATIENNGGSVRL